MTLHFVDLHAQYLISKSEIGVAITDVVARSAFPRIAGRGLDADSRLMEVTTAPHRI
jgi:hypothetical protein